MKSTVFVLLAAPLVLFGLVDQPPPNAASVTTLHAEARVGDPLGRIREDPRHSAVNPDNARDSA